MIQHLHERLFSALIPGMESGKSGFIMTGDAQKAGNVTGTINSLHIRHLSYYIFIGTKDQKNY